MFDVSNLADGETARCSRCGHFLTRFRADELSRVMAFSVSALILLALACSFPFMAFKASGLESLMTLPQAALELWRNDMPYLAFLVAVFIIIIPAVVLILIVILVGELVATLQKARFVLDGFSQNAELYKNLNASLRSLDATLNNTKSLTRQLSDKPNSLLLPVSAGPDPIPRAKHR